MIDLENVLLDGLQDLLGEVDEKVPAQRVITAIGHKLGLSSDTLAALHDVSDQTIRNWLKRFTDRPSAL